jgi:hypothetical protein
LSFNIPLPDLSNISFFEILPKIALGGLVAVVVVFVWTIWRSISPAAPGISLGYLEVLGRYGGGRMLKSIKGTLVEATQIFLNPQVERLFKQMIVEDIEAKVKLAPDDKDMVELKAAAEEFRNDTKRLSEMCRIVVTRERFFGKHVIVQWGHVDKPLSEYAAVDPESKFTFSMGFLSQGIVTGEIETFADPWTIRNLGECQVHLFKPDVMNPGNPSRPPEYLAKIALHAPSYVEAEEALKAKEEQITQLKRENQRMGEELGAATTHRDSLITATEGFMTKGEGMPPLTPRRFTMSDFIMLTAPTVIGYVAARYMGFELFYGVFIGLLAGSYLVYRRME